ncbi:MAG: chloride channel protein [Proteobacteria bacterium]|nr:chloride channel protein [Pseudomonadota bacterium]MBS0572232.1 chloride channel protein [Pseudomonadota bacterium]
MSTAGGTQELRPARRFRWRAILRRAFARRGEAGLLAASLVVGALAGAVVAVMSLISHELHSLLFDIRSFEWLSMNRIHRPQAILLAPITGGLILGLLMRLRGRRRGQIVDPIEANALYGGRMSVRDSLWLVLQNLVSNGFGASVGLEAGYTQLSSSFASAIAARLNLRREDVRTLVGCGAAGAIAAAFHAPLTGAFYAFELIIGTYSIVKLGPVMVSAITATALSHGVPDAATFVVASGPGQLSAIDFVPAILLGILCAGLGIGFMRTVAAIEAGIGHSPIPQPLRPAIGGLLVGALALISPQILAAGHGALHINLEHEAPLAVVALVLVLKACASAVSIGFGFRGGLFFASLLLGALVGKLAAYPVDLLVPGGLGPSSMAVIGMATMAATLIGGPLTMTFLALELTGEFPITVLVLAGAIAASFVSRRTFGYSFATWRFHVRGENIRSAHDVGWMRNLTAGALMRQDVRTAPLAATADEFRADFPLGSAKWVVVVGGGAHYAGIADVAEVHADAGEAAPRTMLADFLRCRGEVLLPSMNVREASQMFERADSEILAVVADMEGRKVIGQLSESHALKRYSEELDRRRRDVLGEFG